MGTLILMRHGQSVWNKKNVFTGWVDIPLSPEGIQEALEAGKELIGGSIDIVFTSTLIRGTMSAFLALSSCQEDRIPVLMHPEESLEYRWGKCYSSEEQKKMIPVFQAWQLNERTYGELQGLNKQTMRELYGDIEVLLWRRSYEKIPPSGESLKMTAERTLPFFKTSIVPYLEKGNNVFIAAHGNSLRSIVMELEGLSVEEIINVEIPTGKCLFYSYARGAFVKKTKENI